VKNNYGVPQGPTVQLSLIIIVVVVLDQYYLLIYLFVAILMLLLFLKYFLLHPSDREECGHVASRQKPSG
jgi:hypothetical protein